MNSKFFVKARPIQKDMSENYLNFGTCFELTSLRTRHINGYVNLENYFKIYAFWRETWVAFTPGPLQTF